MLPDVAPPARRHAPCCPTVALPLRSLAVAARKPIPHSVQNLDLLQTVRLAASVTAFLAAIVPTGNLICATQRLSSGRQEPQSRGPGGLQGRRLHAKGRSGASQGFRGASGEVPCGWSSPDGFVSNFRMADQAPRGLGGAGSRPRRTEARRCTLSRAPAESLGTGLCDPGPPGSGC